MFLLVAAVALSLSAQLAVAKPGLSGWLLSAVPALAFIGLSKLVLTTSPTPPADTRATVRAAPVEESAASVPPVEPTAAPVRHAPQPAASPVALEPVALVPVEPTRPGPVAPVSPAAFTRRNGVPLVGEVTR